MPFKIKAHSRAWIVFTAAYLAGVAATINQFKVPPALPELIGVFGLDLTAAGFMMSAFAVIGIGLALPAGFFLKRWGARRTGVLACLFLVVGGCLGSVAGSAWLLTTSRAVEGLGMGFIAVAMPTVISMWFPVARRGLPMGLWATWVPIGSIIMYNASPALIAAHSWRSVWLLVAGVSAVAAIMCWALLRQPPDGPFAEEDRSVRIGFREGFVQILTCSEIWHVSIAFGCFTTIALAMYTFLPVYLTTVRGFSLPDAGFTVSLIMSTTLFSSPLAGRLSDYIGSRKILFSLPFLALAVMLIIAFKTVGGQIQAFMILFGLMAGGVPMAAFSLVPDVVPDRRLVGVGMALVVMGQNAGMVLGPVLFGSFVESMGWVLAGTALVPVALLGFGMAWRVNARECLYPTNKMTLLIKKIKK